MKYIFPIAIIALAGAFITVLLTTESKPIEPYGVLQGVTIKEKDTKSLCSSSRCNMYYVTFEKDEQKVKLKAIDVNMYDAVQEGTVVDVEYDDDYFIRELNFTDLEKEKTND